MFSSKLFSFLKLHFTETACLHFCNMLEEKFNFTKYGYKFYVKNNYKLIIPLFLLSSVFFSHMGDLVRSSSSFYSEPISSFLNTHNIHQLSDLCRSPAVFTPHRTLHRPQDKHSLSITILV